MSERHGPSARFFTEKTLTDLRIGPGIALEAVEPLPADASDAKRFEHVHRLAYEACVLADYALQHKPLGDDDVRTPTRRLSSPPVFRDYDQVRTVAEELTQTLLSPPSRPPYAQLNFDYRPAGYNGFGQPVAARECREKGLVDLAPGDQHWLNRRLQLVMPSSDKIVVGAFPLDPDVLQRQGQLLDRTVMATTFLDPDIAEKMPSPASKIAAEQPYAFPRLQCEARSYGRAGRGRGVSPQIMVGGAIAHLQQKARAVGFHIPSMWHERQAMGATLDQVVYDTAQTIGMRLRFAAVVAGTNTARVRYAEDEGLVEVQGIGADHDVLGWNVDLELIKARDRMPLETCDGMVPERFVPQVKMLGDLALQLRTDLLNAHES